MKKVITKPYTVIFEEKKIVLQPNNPFMRKCVINARPDDDYTAFYLGPAIMQDTTINTDLIVYDSGSAYKPSPYTTQYNKYQVRIVFENNHLKIICPDMKDFFFDYEILKIE